MSRPNPIDGIKAEKIIKDINRAERMYADKIRREVLVDPWGKSLRGRKDLGKLITPRQIEEQKYSLNGHIITAREKFKKAEFLAEVYDEFLRMYQLAAESAKAGKVIRSMATNRPVDTLSFNDWIHESKMTMQWRLDKELPKLKRNGKVSKLVYEVNVEIARLGIEALNEYLKASDRTQIGMV